MAIAGFAGKEKPARRLSTFEELIGCTYEYLFLFGAGRRNLDEICDVLREVGLALAEEPSSTTGILASPTQNQQEESIHEDSMPSDSSPIHTGKNADELRQAIIDEWVQELENIEREMGQVQGVPIMSKVVLPTGGQENKPSGLRLLIVEDNEERLQCFRSWLPDDIRVVVARSAGRAIGIVQRDRGTVYAGILLDHDLVEQIATEGELKFSGTQVSEAIIKHISADVPVLIHSMNYIGAKTMFTKLEQAGFWLTRIPMISLTQDKLEAWLEEVREIWKIVHG